jgi:transposase
MDAITTYPLDPRRQGTLIPLPAGIVVDTYAADDTAPDLMAFLWRRFCQLAVLWFLTLAALRRLQRQVVDWKLQANYWRAVHGRAVRREADLTDQNQLLQAQIRELERRLYGRKAETAAANKPATNPNAAAKGQRRSRGQQPGNKGPRRRCHDHLPTTHEPCVLPAAQRRCPCCGEAFEEIPGSADGDILEIEVKAHRRRYQRQRYRRRCTCPQQPAVITAPPPDKLIPKSSIGLSLWALILQRKFVYFQPLHRVLAELRSHGLNLSSGTIIGGLQKLVPLFQPLYQLLVEHNRAEGHWHCDETRWLVFEKRADKAGFSWNLWVFAAKESIVFVLDPTRSHDVPEGHFGDAAGIANVDRFSAYKAMAQVKAGQIILAFCWAHVRRDFLEVLTSWSALAEWAWSWVEDIGVLYQRHDQRLAVRDQPLDFAAADRSLREQVEHLRQRWEQELSRPDLRPPQRKVLTSLQKHWSGLTVFVDKPAVPLDNNRAERCHRGPVVARKNFYGSGSLWSGRLAAMLFSLFQTLQAWNLDVAKWLTSYLAACAANHGKPPPDPQDHLPWNLSAAERERWRVATAQPSCGNPPNANSPTTTV